MTDYIYFDNNEESRRKYLLARVAGLPTPPPYDFNRGEEPFGIVSSWILNQSVPWWEDMRNDVRVLLKIHLDNAKKGKMDDLEINQLAGLLSVAAIIQDNDCGKKVIEFLTSGRSGKLPEAFHRIENENTFYGEIGYLLFRVLDYTYPPGSKELFQQSLSDVKSLNTKGWILLYFARREPDVAADFGHKMIVECIEKNAFNELDFTIHVLHEICWDMDDEEVINHLEEWFERESSEFKREIITASVNIFDNSTALWSIEYAIEKMLIKSESRGNG